jgi:cell division protein FtsB
MKLVIRQHRPMRRAVIGAGIVALTLLIVAVVFDLGHWRSLARAMVPNRGSQSLSDEVARLRDENTALRYDVARLKRGEEIDKSSRGDNHLQFMQLQAEVAKLKADIKFYREVVGASDVDGGAQVKGIQLKALDVPGRFSYRLVLAHIDENDSETEGSIRIVVKGDLNGQSKVLAQGDIVEAGSDNLAFKFKHFRLFEGSLKLPDGFIPRQISVAAQSRIPTASSSSETYDWAAVQN